MKEKTNPVINYTLQEFRAAKQEAYLYIRAKAACRVKGLRTTKLLQKRRNQAEIN